MNLLKELFYILENILNQLVLFNIDFMQACFELIDLYYKVMFFYSYLSCLLVIIFSILNI